MRALYFIIFILIIATTAAGTIGNFQQFFDIQRESFAANLLANEIAFEVIKTEAAQEQEQAKPIRMILVGDVMLDRGVGNFITAYNNPRFPFLHVADTLRSADIAFANLEGPISDRGTNLKLKYSFRFNPNVVEGLTFAGFDVLSVANNHIWDWGRDALEDTVNILRAHDITPVGAGLNYDQANAAVVRDVRGTKIAFLAYSTLTELLEADGNTAGRSDFNPEKIIKKVKTMKTEQGIDIVAISFHWGIEYETRSNKEQQDIAHTLIDAGADLIIGHHPHVIQEIEKYKQGWIIYSLGNFIFDQHFSDETMQGLMAHVIIQDKKIKDVESTIVKINKQFQPEMPEKAHKVYNSIDTTRR